MVASDACFLRFRPSAAVAADPGISDEAVMGELAKASELVALHISDFPCRNGKPVMSSAVATLKIPLNDVVQGRMTWKSSRALSARQMVNTVRVDHRTATA